MAILRKLLAVLALAATLVTASGCLSIEAKETHTKRDEVRTEYRDDYRN